MSLQNVRCQSAMPAHTPGDSLSLSDRGLARRRSYERNKKAPSEERCCPDNKLHVPSFPSAGGTDISICALEAFQPTVCLPWTLFRQVSSERASPYFRYRIGDLPRGHLPDIGLGALTRQGRSTALTLIPCLPGLHREPPLLPPQPPRSPLPPSRRVAG
jgi:hypothetical protein